MNEITPSGAKSKIWQGFIEEQAGSGKTIRVYCQEHAITPSAFHYWKKKQEGSRVLGRVGRFVAMAGKERLSLGSPRIHLPNGVKVELGGNLESESVSRFLLRLCGVGHLPEGCRAKS